MYAITAASGQLGTLVVDRLLGKVPADQIVAAVRDPSKAAALRAKGVLVREADYDRPDALPAALVGVKRLLLISGPEIGRRSSQHRAVIEAAAAAEVGLIAYTSVLHADSSPLIVAPDHRDTEAALAASGVPHVIMRNGWYTENRLSAISTILRDGVVVGAAGNGRQSSATRADYADAAMAALTGESHAGRTYELAGDEAWILSDLAAEISRQTGRDVTYRDMSPEAYREALVQAGTPAQFAELLSHADAFTREGGMADESGDLSRLIGRQTTSLAVAVADALAKRS